MIIKFKSICLHNFLSFEDATLNISGVGYTLVNGVNEYLLDNSVSNGSGKSSIWESIIWCLTGETSRGTKDVINKQGEDGAFVEVIFEVNSIEYRLIRYKEYANVGTNLKVFINGVDKSGKGIRDTEKLLQDYLPDLTSSLIGSVIILGQGLPQKFTNNTPSGRKEVLERLSQSDYMIDDLKNKIFKRRDTLGKHIRESEDSILSFKSRLDILLKQKLEIKDKILLTVQKDWDSEIKTVENSIAIKTEESDSLHSLIHSTSIELDNTRERFKELEIESSTLSYSIKEKFSKKLIHLKGNINNIKNEVGSLDKSLQDIRSVKDVCPTCGQKLPNVVKIDTADIEGRRENLLINLSSVEEELKFNELAQENELTQSLLDIQNSKELMVQQGTALKDRLTELNKELDCCKEYIHTLNTSLSKLYIEKNTFDTTLNELNLRLHSTEQDISNLENLLFKCEKDLHDFQSRQEITTKLSTLATRDFRGYLLSEAINYINIKSRDYSKDIFNHELVEFMLEGNNINIKYASKHYESLSGGERQKVDIIVQFAIRDMLCKFLDFSSNIIVLDEIFDNLDYFGCDRIVKLISDKLTDIENVFIITHRGSELNIPYDTIIKVVKNKYGNSYIES